MEVQPQLVLLQKTLLAIEGLGRQLYPDLDLWATAKPFLEKWLRQQVGPQAFFRQLKENLPFFAEQLPQMPRMLYEVLSLTREEKIRALSVNKTIDEGKQKRRSWYRGLGTGVFFTMLTLSAGAYFKWFNNSDLTLPAFIIALAGGFLALNQRTNRS